jgi:ADP-heptose:LPS heptosyltransferase
MIKRDILSWWLRPQFLQPWGRKSDVLFAGPWRGEFGWELLNWQAFLRWLAPQYQKVIVCCRESQFGLYRDFAHELIPHTLGGTAECNRALEAPDPAEFARIQSLIPPGADWLDPARIGWQPASRKVFYPYGNFRGELATDIVFHPRGRGFGTDRNWSAENWSALVAKLQGAGYRLTCIGLRSATLEVPGDFVDQRDIPLEHTMDLLASARLIIGPSSGPMHLASLCKCPHLVWTDAERYARGRTNRTKYEHWWNPFGTKAIVLDDQGFQPSVDHVFEAIQNFLTAEKSHVPS